MCEKEKKSRKLQDVLPRAAAVQWGFFHLACSTPPPPRSFLAMRGRAPVLSCVASRWQTLFCFVEDPDAREGQRDRAKAGTMLFDQPPKTDLKVRSCTTSFLASCVVLAGACVSRRREVGPLTAVAGSLLPSVVLGSRFKHRTPSSKAQYIV